MEVSVNNQVRELPEDCSIQQMLNTLMPDKQKGIAVAINDEVISKTQWNNHIIDHNDQILIISATQGG